MNRYDAALEALRLAAQQAGNESLEDTMARAHRYLVFVVPEAASPPWQAQRAHGGTLGTAANMSSGQWGY